MSEILTAAGPPDKNTEHQQLDLSAEPGWSGTQLDLTSEKGWTEAQPMGQDSEEYRNLEFDVEPLSAEAVPPVVTAEAAAPGEGLPPESPSDKAELKQLTPEDHQRVKKEAKEYFDYFEDPQLIEQMRVLLAKHEQDTKAAMLKQFQELGIADVNNERVMENLVIQKVNEGMTSAREKKIKELAEAAFPYKEGEKTKTADKGRESLTKILSMPEEEFASLQEDWQIHEVNKAHEQALKDDKSYKVGEQRKLAKDEIAGLDEKYGGTLAQISRLPLEREPGGQTQKALDGYLERHKKIEATKNGLVDPELAADVSRAQAVRDLEAQLRQKYQDEGLGEEQIKSRLDESKDAIDTWLKNIKGDSLPLADLNRFEHQQNKERMLNAKRQKVREYIGSTLLPRTVRGIFSRPETKSINAENINLKEVMARGIDHNGSHSRAGGEALLGGGGGESLWRKTVANLELARNLSRNEGKLMQGLIYLTLAQRGLEGGLTAAWSAIPEQTKKEAKKKFMLGMSVTARAIVRASVKAAEKSRKAGAVGASAAAIKMGTLRS